MERDFTAELADLVSGKTSEIVVEQTEFLVFLEAWLNHPEKPYIVGEAGLNGRIIYRFQKEAKN